MADNNNDNEANEPATSYGGGFRIFNSFQDQELYELKLMASLDPKKILEQMRMFINTAYGMHGYDPNDLPKKHTIKIIKRG